MLQHRDYSKRCRQIGKDFTDVKENIWGQMLINEGCAYVGSLQKLNPCTYNINA